MLGPLDYWSRLWERLCKLDIILLRRLATPHLLLFCFSTTEEIRQFKLVKLLFCWPTCVPFDLLVIGVVKTITLSSLFL